MKIEYHPLAAAELAEAKNWYERQHRGLGKRFLDDYEVSLQLLLKYPFFCAELKSGLRRFLLKRFPYQIMFSVSPSVIHILAIAHTHRKPNYWIDRLRN